MATDLPGAPAAADVTASDGCTCGVDLPPGHRTLGLPHGIDAGPVLADPPGVRHLARREPDGRWRTLCGELVPQEHRCPTEAELRAAEVWTLRSCGGCHQAYLTS